MSAHLDDARRAWEAAKLMERYFQNFSDAGFSAASRIFLTNATQDYAKALVDDQLRKFDSAGIRFDDTLCAIEGLSSVVKINTPIADVEAGRVKVWAYDPKWGRSDHIWADELRPRWGHNGYGGEVMEWQPIETAPKDGTAFLAVGHGLNSYHCSFICRWSDVLDDWMENYTRKRFEPTAWQPLPALPPLPEVV